MNKNKLSKKRAGKPKDVAHGSEENRERRQEKDPEKGKKIQILLPDHPISIEI